MNRNKYLIFLILSYLPVLVYSSPTLPLITQSTKSGVTTYSGSVSVILLMTFLVFLPAMLMTMTSFMRIVIVLALLRQALGLSQTPSNQILIGISLFLSLFIMTPVLHQMNTNALKPYLSQKISLSQAIDNAAKPLHGFMLSQTRKDDLNFFVNLSNSKKIQSRNNIPFSLLIPSFMTSELQTAFQIGFILFIPFLIIDLIVSSTLMAMGMMMVSPMVISLPLKIMLFVMIDGWHLIFQTLASSFIH